MSPLKSLTSSKGVVRNWEPVRTDPDEIKENVPMITDVHRIVVKWNNLEVKTNTLILTINAPKIPDAATICYLNIPYHNMYQILLDAISVRDLAM